MRPLDGKIYRTLVFFFVGWKPFRSVQTIAELWDIGGYRGWGDSGPGGNGRYPGEAKNPGHERRIPPAGGQPEAASLPVNDVHQARSI